MALEEDTLLGTFLSVSRNPSSIENPVLECGSEQWTYGDLDSISSGLALQLYEKYGSKPTVAVISENHPYMLAILLATWKLSGIFVPMDPHAPLPMVKQMLLNVEATCAVIPEREKGLADLLQGNPNTHAKAVYLLIDIAELKMGAVIIPQGTTMVSLSQTFLDQDAVLSPSHFPLPEANNMAIYIHTSSATSVMNLKCVQWRHATVAQGTGVTARWFSKAWPPVKFDEVRTLGLSPWSHSMGILIDIGGATFHTGGCLVMATPPSGYPVRLGNEDSTRSIMGKDASEMDILDRLLETALCSKPEVLVCVPWVLEGFRDRYQRLLAMKMEAKAFRVKEMLQRFKCIGIGGAALSRELLLWACGLSINIANMMGLTEMGCMCLAVFQNSSQWN